MFGLKEKQIKKTFKIKINILLDFSNNEYKLNQCHLPNQGNKTSGSHESFIKRFVLFLLFFIHGSRLQNHVEVTLIKNV